MESKKGTKRAAIVEEAEELSRVAKIDATDALYATSNNARKVQITNRSNHITTEFHRHHYHPVTTIVNPAPAHTPAYSSLTAWQRSERSLREVESLLVKAVAQAEAHFKDMVSKKRPLDEARDALDAAAINQRGVLEECAAGVSKVNVDLSTVGQLSQDLKSAEEDLAASESALAKLDLIKGDAIVVKGGSFEKPDDPKHIATMLPLLQRIGLQDGLLAALPKVAAKKASSRSDSESLVVSEIEKALKEYVIATRNKLASHSMPEVNTALRVADQQHRTAAVALKTAEAERCRIATEFRKAQLASDVAKGEVERAQVDLDKASEFLKQFRDGPLAGFRSMDEKFAYQLLERASGEKKSPESQDVGQSPSRIKSTEAPLLQLTVGTAL